MHEAEEDRGGREVKDVMERKKSDMRKRKSEI